MKSDTNNGASSSASKSKRLLLQAGVALLGVLGGAYYGWQRWQADTSLQSVPENIWQRSFSNLQGEEVRLSQFQGKPLLINFWATWCPPCVAEMPLLNAFYKGGKDKGIQVLGIAVDQKAVTQRFVQDKQIVFPVVLAGADGIALSKALGNQAGGLPFSIWVLSDGSIGFVKIGELSEEELNKLKNELV